ncbi:MAG: hypothetical protein OEU68_17140 [Nitrospira sp.]|nr:hypothetical protein [Nitrospira sp.]MDH4244703.1 hypothetical protein [Nitrospira sp.]MDH4355696.1 hypothetical protein [Nitrospira sp.]MDH5319469.1 hypothetical protein [Nitrospira sp.]
MRTKASEMVGLLGIWSGVMLLLFTTGCAGGLYGWTVRTTSTALSTSAEAASLPQETVAVLTPLSVASLRGNEAGMGQYLVDVIHKVAPNWSIVSERQAISAINKSGFAGQYERMRSGAELSHVLDRDSLRAMGEVLGARYVFQPRLAFFQQIMTDRWTVPAVNVLAAQTRSATMRLSLQLWDTQSGELIWSSAAETNLQSEAVTQDPMFMEDVARVTFGSMLSDLLNRKTGSKYTPLNQVLDLLIHEPFEKNGTQSVSVGEEDPDAGRTP